METTPPELPFVDELRERVDAPREAIWAALLGLLGRSLAGTSMLARILGCDPARGTGTFAGKPGETVPGFRIERAEPGRLLALRGRHRFARYALTFVVEDGELRALTHAAFPGLRGRLYRAVVIGSGGHRVIARQLLRKVARAARRRVPTSP